MEKFCEHLGYVKVVRTENIECTDCKNRSQQLENVFDFNGPKCLIILQRILNNKPLSSEGLFKLYMECTKRISGKTGLYLKCLQRNKPISLRLENLYDLDIEEGIEQCCHELEICACEIVKSA